MSRLRRWGGDTLAVAGGALLPLGFAPFGLWPLPILALALGLQAWIGRGARRGFWRGWLFGVTAYGFGLNWVHISIDRYGGAALPVALGITFLLVAFLALYPAVLGAVLAARWQRDRSIWAVVAGLGGGWTLLEWLRGWLLTGFPWLELGTSQVDSPLSVLAPLGGSLAVTAVMALMAGLLWAMVVAVPVGRVVAVLLLGLLFGGLVLFGPRDWTRPAGEPLSVAVIQGNVSQEMKWQVGQLEATLARYRELTEASLGSRLIVWPETAVPAFYDSVADGFLAELESAAQARGSDLLLGVPFRDVASGAYYNGVLGLGRERSAYFKRHLVPFGEYLPLRPLLGSLLEFMQIPQGDFRSGPQQQRPLPLAGTKVGVTICYEVVFAREVRAALPEAGLLVNVSNDAWFGDSIGPQQHLEIARMRALETGRYLIRATNTGISAIIGPRGEVIARSTQFAVDTLHGEVTPLTGATPYVRYGDAPVLALAGLAVVVAGLRRRRRGY